MGDTSTQFLDMCFSSILDADKIVFCWGMEDQPTKEKYLEWKNKHPDKFDIIENKFDQKDIHMNGKQRNFYLQYLKEKYPKDWALCLDTDEVVDDSGIIKIKEFIETNDKGVYCVKMRHLIHYLNHEDSNQPIHWVLNRLFKISSAYGYQEVEHPILQPIADELKIDYSNGERQAYKTTDCATIWHLSYIPGLFKIRNQYLRQKVMSNIHSQEYLRQWAYSHYFGTYPKKAFNVEELATPILEYFGLSRDELYFQNRRQLELKHLVDAADWALTFKPNKVLLCGDGMGQRTYALRRIGIDAEGFDMSTYAVENSQFALNTKEKIRHWIQRIEEPIIDLQDTYDLVVAYDVLEHLTYQELEKALDNCHTWSTKLLLVSVPTIGDSNLEADKTHVIKETKEWWQNKIAEHGFKILSTPEHFLFQEQLILAIKRGVVE